MELELEKNSLKLLYEDWEYVYKNPKQALDISMRYANSRFQDRGHQKFILEESWSLIKPGSSLKIGEMEYVRWRETYEVLREQEIVGDLDIKQLYTLEFLD